MSYESKSNGQMAEDYRREATTSDRRARKAAQRAGVQYEYAERARSHARWLTSRADLWDEPSHSFDPAGQERYAQTLTRLGDIYLESSFSYTAHARFLRDLAKSYAKRAREDARRLAEYQAELNAGWGVPAGHDGQYVVVDPAAARASGAIDVESILGWELEWFQVRTVVEEHPGAVVLAQTKDAMDAYAATLVPVFVPPAQRSPEYQDALHAEAAADGHQAGQLHDESACGLLHHSRSFATSLIMARHGFRRYPLAGLDYQVSSLREFGRPADLRVRVMTYVPGVLGLVSPGQPGTLEYDLAQMDTDGAGLYAEGV